MKKDFLTLYDISDGELLELLELSKKLKQGYHPKPLQGKSIAMIFQKPSLRTRVSFEVGISALGGNAIILGQEAIGLGNRESVQDISKTLDRYVEGIAARVFDHTLLEMLSSESGTPVINMLSDVSHPCQILSDILTLREHKKLFPNVKIAYVGDGNNVANSWLEASTLYPFELLVISPEGYEPDPKRIKLSQEKAKGKVRISSNLLLVKDADVIYTDVWTSMGQEENETRKKNFLNYQINQKLLDLAKHDAIVMHCLPAHVGDEITEDVLRGKQSVVYDQAENRLHAQKALLVKMFG